MLSEKEAAFLPFRDKDRLIYCYWDGRSLRQVDPLTLCQKLFEVGQELNMVLKIAAFPDYPEAPRAQEDALKIIRDVFSVKPLAEGGIADVECLQLVDHFSTYFGRLTLLYQPLSDMTKGNVGLLRAFLGRAPTYEEFFGMWLNRNRAQNRDVSVVAMGVAIAMGVLTPGEDYFRAITNGEDEARSLHAQFMSRSGD